MAPGLSPDAPTMSCMVAAWNPWRAKQPRAASRIRSRWAFALAGVSLGMNDLCQCCMIEAVALHRAACLAHDFGAVLIGVEIGDQRQASLFQKRCQLLG